MFLIIALSKKQFNKEMKLTTWIKKDQEMKRMQKMNATKIIALTRKSDTMNTLSARKNIVEIKRFKKLIIFKVIFEENKKILKLSDFWIKNVAITTTLKREKFKMIIYKIKIKSIF